MRINKLCQICERQPRTRIILYSMNVWLLCEDCGTNPSSKFSKGEQLDPVTSRYKPELTYLRDIHRGPDTHSGPYPKAFLFQTSDGSRYMSVPTLYRGYEAGAYLDMKTGALVTFPHDTSITVLEWIGQ